MNIVIFLSVKLVVYNKKENSNKFVKYVFYFTREVKNMYISFVLRHS